jgi:hypothetical protein
MISFLDNFIFYFLIKLVSITLLALIITALVPEMQAYIISPKSNNEFFDQFY